MFRAGLALVVGCAAAGCYPCSPEDFWRLDHHGPMLDVETTSEGVWNLVGQSGVDVCGHSDAGWHCGSRVPYPSADPFTLPEDAIAVDGGVTGSYPQEIRYWAVDTAGALWRSDLADPIGTDAPWTSVSANDFNVCGITTTGSAECIFEETRVARAGPFVDVALADGVACAASRDRPVACWTSSRDVPAPGQVLSAVHGNTSGQFCGVDTSGSIGCWSQYDAVWVELDTCGDVGPFVDAVVVGPAENEYFDTGACGRQGDGTIACFTIDGVHLSDARVPLDGLSAKGTSVCGINDDAVTCFGSL